MKSYAEREIFTHLERRCLRRAMQLVDAIASSWNNELRCHELARAVCQVLSRPEARVVDGKVGPIEHSWILVLGPSYQWDDHELPGKPVHTEPYIGTILDTYCPGRLPQVQLVHNTVTVAKLYHPGLPRDDIKHDIIERLVQEMRAAADAEQLAT